MIRPALLSLLLALAASPAFAQDEPIGRGDPTPPPAPATPDGRPGDAPAGLEIDEPFTRPPEQLFISPAGEPFRAAIGAPYPVGAWFARADADHDGVLDPKEFAADALTFFDVLDTDHDGRVDGFENADYEKAVAPEIAAVMRRPPPREGGGPGWRPFSRADEIWGGPQALTPGKPGRNRALNRQGAAQYGLLNEPHPVRGADGDLDGRISRSEAQAAALRRFGLLDLDDDGRLPLVDLPRTPAQALFDDSPPPQRRKP